jgi:hypothetical protein
MFRFMYKIYLFELLSIVYSIYFLVNNSVIPRAWALRHGTQGLLAAVLYKGKPVFLVNSYVAF